MVIASGYLSDSLPLARQRWGLQPGSSFWEEVAVCPGPQGGGGTGALICLGLGTPSPKEVQRPPSHLYLLLRSPSGTNSLGLAVFSTSASFEVISQSTSLNLSLLLCQMGTILFLLQAQTHSSSLRRDRETLENNDGQGLDHVPRGRAGLGSEQ